MVDDSNFIVRISGRRADSFYIDYLGSYKVLEIAKVAGLKPIVVKEIYIDNVAAYDEVQDVYYFNSLVAAKKAISDILSKIGTEKKGRLVLLTESEVEYIRKALINEGANTIHIKNKVKDAIFKKLNN
jgi:hypothetical protein